MLARILRNPFTWIMLAFGLFIYMGLKKAKDSAIAAATSLVNGAKTAAVQGVVKPVQTATVALANVVGVNEAGGFNDSDGQADPYVAYNTARVAYAVAHNYVAGTDNYRNPPGFPDFQTWQGSQSASWFSW